MQQFCPLCSKRGFRRKIKALQINFNEALWTCEGEECEWPFGYEDIIYIPREVGNTWSCYWDDDKPPLQSVNECMPVSTELSLYTPPETPAEANIKDSPSDILCSDNNVAINSLNHSIIVNEVQSTNIVDSSDHGTYCLTSSTQINNISKIGNLSTNDKDNLCTNDKDNLCTNDKDNLCITDAQGLSNIENISKDIFIKTDKFESQRNISILEDNASISKRNLKIKPSKVQLKIQNKNVLLTKNADKNQDDASSDLKEDVKSTEKSTASNLKIKTIEIDGLPPVSLSYEVPAPLLPTTTSNKKTNPNTLQRGNISQSINTNLSTPRPNGTHKLLTMISKQSSGQNINAGKRYAKFHFSAIKKKTETTNNNDSLSSNNKSLLNSNKDSSNNKGTDQIQKQDSSKAITSGPSIDTNKPIKTEVIKPEPAASANGTIDSNLNIDTLLNDFIKEETLSDKINETYILPDLDDDWINSLLH